MNPVSWSELDCWIQDPKEWERRYILGLRDKPTFAMERGTNIHNLLQTGDRSFEKDKHTPDEVRVHDKILADFKTLMDGVSAEFEYKAEVIILGIATKGFWDVRIPSKNHIIEIKTGGKLWTPLQTNDHGQLAFYSLQHAFLFDEVPEMTLFSASTQNGKTVAIDYKATARQMEKIKDAIVGFKGWCNEYGLWDLRLSSRDSIQV